MEIKLQRKEFLKGLVKCQGIVPSRGALGILSYVLLQTVPGGVELIATDLEVSIRIFSEATVIEEGQITLLSRKAFEIVRELPEAEIHITPEDGNRLKIKCGNSSFVVNTLPATDFPDCVHENKNLKEIDSSIIADGINKTLFAVPTGEARYALSGVLFEPENNVLNMVATDGHRLSCVAKKIAADSEIKTVKAILSKKFLTEAQKAISDKSQTVKLGFERNHVILKTDNAELTGRLIEGTFPNYKQVIPETKKQIKFDRVALAAAIKRVSILSDERNRGVKVNVNNGQAILSSNESDCGNASESVGVDYKGKEITLGFNADYVLDVLRVIEGDSVCLGFNDELGPCLVTSESNSEYQCVIMPLRVD